MLIGAEELMCVFAKNANGGDAADSAGSWEVLTLVADGDNLEIIVIVQHFGW